MVLRRAAVECPKKVAGLVDLPTALREFAGCRSLMSHLSFLRVWSHIKDNNLQHYVSSESLRCMFSSGILGQTLEIIQRKSFCRGGSNNLQENNSDARVYIYIRKPPPFRRVERVICG
ncbi:uncharacterized protein LOC133901917 isoform X2 [Phragmites australis]|uniref:uncharacterized protein LOC133901917 isoform X2 n=1 Tax=Phragmites australis TaxID=29695 RepID=UPI002D768BAB|nr:uncharacterized protein LOC133901917 isoform X2 [Phragmites australis]